MEKKIIAIALVLILMVTAFVGCTQKHKIIEINGTEFVAATDENGETIIDDQNRIIVHPTEKNGKIPKDSNGEKMTNYVELEGSFFKGNDTLYASDYSLKVLEGWSIKADKIVKNETNDTVHIRMVYVGDVTEKSNYISFANKAITANDAIIAELEKNDFTVEIEDGEYALCGKIPSVKMSFLVKDSNGKMLQYAENYYFNVGKKVYKAEYACIEEAYYDIEFSFENYLANGLALVD